MHEVDVELAALELFKTHECDLRTGSDIDDAGERADAAQVMLKGRLGSALHRLNPDLPHETIEVFSCASWPAKPAV